MIVTAQRLYAHAGSFQLRWKCASQLKRDSINRLWKPWPTQTCIKSHQPHLLQRESSFAFHSGAVGSVRSWHFHSRGNSLLGWIFCYNVKVFSLGPAPELRVGGTMTLDLYFGSFNGELNPLSESRKDLSTTERGSCRGRSHWSGRSGGWIKAPVSCSDALTARIGLRCTAAQTISMRPQMSCAAELC